MGIKQIKPTNPASRNQSYAGFDEITQSTPHKPLTKGKGSSGGRNNTGEQTIWFRGGGHKRRYRKIDFLGWNLLFYFGDVGFTLFDRLVDFFRSIKIVS
jgi:ribosomal protein L2